MHSTEPAAFKNVGAACGFQKRQAQQQINSRRQIERMTGELAGDLVGRICYDRLAVRGRFRLLQKVSDEVQRLAVIDDVGSNDSVPSIAQHKDNVPADSCWLPQPVRKRLDA